MAKTVYTTSQKSAISRLRPKFEKILAARKSGLAYDEFLELCDPENGLHLTRLQQRICRSREYAYTLYEKWAAPVFPDYPTALQRKKHVESLRKSQINPKNLPSNLALFISKAALDGMKVERVCSKNCSVLLNKVLRINGKLCFIITRTSESHQFGRNYIPVSLSSGKMKKFDMLIVQWLNPKFPESHYIIPTADLIRDGMGNADMCHLYIPLQDTVKNSKWSGIDYDRYRNNWNILR